MRRALPALAVLLALLLWMWWGRGEEGARSVKRAAPEDTAEPWDAPEPPVIEEPAAVAAPEAPSLPPDVAEQGDCALLLRLLNAETGRPVASVVDLWRLDAPANADWTAGDQLRVTVEVSNEGAKLESLPAGIYRPVCIGARYSSEDPPPFRIEGPTTEITLRIEMPRILHAFVKVVDVDGRPVPTGSMRGGTARRWRDRSRTPAWVRPRTPREGQPTATALGGGGGVTGNRSLTHPIPQPPEGFRVGPFPEDSKKAEVRHVFTIAIDGWSEVLAVVPGTAVDGSTYVGLSVPLATVPGDLRMLDGRTIAEAGGKVSATFFAVPVDASGAAPRLADTPFRVYVAVPGYTSQSFEQKLGEPAPSLVFEPEVKEPVKR